MLAKLLLLAEIFILLRIRASLASGSQSEELCVERRPERLERDEAVKFIAKRGPLAVAIATEKRENEVLTVSKVFEGDHNRIAFVICTNCYTWLRDDVYLFSKDESAFRCILEESPRLTPSLISDSEFFHFGSGSKQGMPPPDRVVGQVGNASNLVNEINSLTELDRLSDGSLSTQGSAKRNLEKNLYRNMNLLGEQCGSIDVESYDKLSFFETFIKGGRPVVIKGGASKWVRNASKINENLLRTEPLASTQIGVKVVPRNLTDGFGYFECTEEVDLWEPKEKLPEHVENVVEDSGKVLVRPAHTTMRMSDFLRFATEKNSTHPSFSQNLSMYVEYLPMVGNLSILSSLIRGVEAPYEDLLPTLQHENLWISAGNTIGCLHFDPFENFLFQIEGSKTFYLFHPHENTKMKEGHLREAIFEFDVETASISRSKLLKSTSIVNSPLDSQVALGFRCGTDGFDAEYCENQHGLHPLECHVAPGDALYVPAFWWHHVKSETSSRLNLAVNYWFKPIFSKMYPCKNCSMHLSTERYRWLSSVLGSESLVV